LVNGCLLETSLAGHAREDLATGARNYDSGLSLRIDQSCEHGYYLRLDSNQAGVAQLVERNLAKVEVASSRLVSRSI
jgi:hypothetical protein